MKKLPILIAALLSASVAVQAQERFTTEETVVVTKTGSSKSQKEQSSNSATSSRTVRLRPGEVIEVFKFQDQFGVDREAFYLPIEGTRVAQVVMERQGRTDRYYLKGRNRGRTAGGVVPRAWLDASGFKPKSTADEMRIQAALKANPIYIIVE